MTANVMNHSKKDEAVSPVVGVMLMLVVTIIIAAVVAMFASSVVSDVEVAPITMLQVNAYQGEPDYNTQLVMTTRGGEAVDLSKVKIFATFDDGEYGLVLKGFDKSGKGDRLLSLGEKLVFFNAETPTEFVSVKETIGNATPSEFAKRLTTGAVVHIMAVYNESTLLYDKDVLVKEGKNSDVSDDKIKLTISFPTTDEEYYDDELITVTHAGKKTIISPGESETYKITPGSTISHVSKDKYSASITVDDYTFTFDTEYDIENEDNYYYTFIYDSDSQEIAVDDVLNEDTVIKLFCHID